MRWEKLLFLHWAWNTGDIQSRLPEGLTVEEFNGTAWLGIVPFLMRSVHPIGLFPVPWLSNFEELNVRTYVRSESGVSGVWFFSLACNQPLAVEIARRGFHLNYVHARMAAEVGRMVRYRSERRGFEAGFYEYPVCGQNAGPALPGTLEHFLVERYVLFSSDKSGGLYAGHVSHRPYEVLTAEVRDWSFSTAVADGFADPQRPPDHAMIARDVDVRAWPIRRVPVSAKQGLAN
jgi:uncharacterized protein YqjF (DUF2071 family)